MNFSNLTSSLTTGNAGSGSGSEGSRSIWIIEVGVWRYDRNVLQYRRIVTVSCRATKSGMWIWSSERSQGFNFFTVSFAVGSASSNRWYNAYNNKNPFIKNLQLWKKSFKVSWYLRGEWRQQLELFAILRVVVGNDDGVAAITSYQKDPREKAQFIRLVTSTGHFSIKFLSNVKNKNNY